ncbi:MAG: pyridoxamine 5'-phosphate oxidase family protein [Candidatus Dormibacteraeota bacterium]|nr:pyridoxamine 5'-phosphate oxidase family protein [Candidatus Dormibacteraeota bacterium]
MAAWHEIERDAPDFARRVRERFEAGRHKTIATLRRDGAPRISGIELQFEDGHMTFGMSGGSLKLLDVRRDPRVAIHSPSLDPPEDGATWGGDAKLAGRAVEMPPPADNPFEGAGFFRLDITEAVLTYLGGSPPDHMVIESWHAGRGWRRQTRD